MPVLTPTIHLVSQSDGVMVYRARPPHQYLVTDWKNTYGGEQLCVLQDETIFNYFCIYGSLNVVIKLLVQGGSHARKSRFISYNNRYSKGKS